MGDETLQRLYAHVQSLAVGNGDEAQDATLLARFVERRDEAAFAAIVHRHGPMVLMTCRRRLSSRDDAEDAWQATFLILAQSANRIRQRDSLASWLHGVACRVSRKLRAGAQKRTAARDALADVKAKDKPDEVSWREVMAILDDELERLPELYRAPLVLCYLEGQTRDEAARQLGCTLDVFRGRLERGRNRLRDRLIRRGVTLAATLIAIEMASSVEAKVSAVLVVKAVKAAAKLGEGASLGSVVCGRIANLIEGVTKTMIATKQKLAAVMLLSLSLIGLSAGVIAQTREPTTAVKLPTVSAAQRGKTEKPDLAKRVAELEKQVARLTKEVDTLKPRQLRDEWLDHLKLLAPLKEDSVMFPLKNITAKEAAAVLKELMGNQRGLNIAVDEASNSLIIGASAKDLPAVKHVLQKIDIAKEPPVEMNSVVKTYALTRLNGNEAVKVLQSLFADCNCRFATVGDKSVIAYAPPRMQLAVEELLKKLEGETKSGKSAAPSK